MCVFLALWIILADNANIGPFILWVLIILPSPCDLVQTGLVWYQRTKTFLIPTRTKLEDILSPILNYLTAVGALAAQRLPRQTGSPWDLPRRRSSPFPGEVLPPTMLFCHVGLPESPQGPTPSWSALPLPCPIPPPPSASNGLTDAITAGALAGRLLIFGPSAEWVPPQHERKLVADVFYGTFATFLPVVEMYPWW